MGPGMSQYLRAIVGRYENAVMMMLGVARGAGV